MFSVGWHAVEITTSGNRRGSGGLLGTGTSPPSTPRASPPLPATATSAVLLPLCPAEPRGQQAGHAHRPASPGLARSLPDAVAWASVHLRRASSGLRSQETRAAPHSRAHPGLSRVVSLRHPEPALPRPPPQLGPRRSTEAAATTSQVHSPGGDSTSRELASGTGQLNAFITFTCTEPPNFTCSPSGFKQALSVCPGGGGITKRGRQVLRNRRGQSSGGKVTRALRTRCGQALGRLGARALTLRSCPPPCAGLHAGPVHGHSDSEAGQPAGGQED